MEKIIRDKYTEIIDGERLGSCDNDVIKSFVLLDKKVEEELGELRETMYNDVEEWADLFEILERFAKFQGISISEIQEARKIKNEKRGKFEDLLTLKG